MHKKELFDVGDSGFNVLSEVDYQRSIVSRVSIQVALSSVLSYTVYSLQFFSNRNTERVANFTQSNKSANTKPDSNYT